jgi:hypothetical protein
MRLRYVVVEIEGPQGIGTKQLPMCFSHAFDNEQIRAAVLAVVPEDKVVGEGQALFVRNDIVAVEKYQPSVFGKLCRGRHDEILLESSEHL